MTEKDLRYCHNFKDPVYPHQALPDTPRKKPKRSKADPQELAKNDEAETGNEDDSSSKKRVIKRKLKKMELDQQRSNEERAGNPNSSNRTDNLELNPITLGDDFEHSDDESKNDEDNKDPNNVPKSNAAQKATKPDEPLEEEGEGEDMDEDESKKSSNVSLPFLNLFRINGQIVASRSSEASPMRAKKQLKKMRICLIYLTVTIKQLF